MPIVVYHQHGRRLRGCCGLQEVAHKVRGLFHSIVFTDMAGLCDDDVARILVALKDVHLDAEHQRELIVHMMTDVDMASG